MQQSISHTILIERNLGKALHDMREEMAEKDIYAPLLNRLETLEEDYRLMRDYMSRGFKDPQADTVYDNILRRAYRLYGAMRLVAMTKRRPAFVSAKIASAGLTLLSDEIAGVLEAFVQDVAMASLNVEGMSSGSTKETYRRHHDYMSRLFDAILVSEPWDDHCAALMRELMLSPTVDSADVMLMLSAVMLATMNVFDPNKWLAMADVYEHATDEKVRQRALVGWVFALPDVEMTLFPEVGKTLERMMTDDATDRQVLEMQMQVMYCNNADADNEKIQSDIIPNLMRHNRFEMTGSGLTEKEDDRMRDILDPGAADRDMEELEKTVGKMVDMQNAGSDIYFGGFSQMKRFAFFNTLSNWFCPFYAEHPQVSELSEKIGNNKFVSKIFSEGPLCDSDKYSFVLALSAMVDRMPANIREMLSNGEALNMPVSEGLDLNDRAFIRRLYLQNLYRFFRLNNHRSDFDNPFAYGESELEGIFYAKPIMASVVSAASVVDLEKFLYKHKRYAAALRVGALKGDIPVVDHILVTAMSHLRLGNNAEAESLFGVALQYDDSNVQALKGMAQLTFASHRYGLAVKYYDKLLEQYPDNRNYLLNKAAAQMCNGDVEAGAAVVFRLEYEHPDDRNVKRALAWTYLMKKEAAKARGIYEGIVSAGNCLRADYLNAAYAAWAQSDVMAAVELFRQYTDFDGKRMSSAEFVDDMKEDRQLFVVYAISDAEVKLMVDMVYGGNYD